MAKPYTEEDTAIYKGSIPYPDPKMYKDSYRKLISGTTIHWCESTSRNYYGWAWDKLKNKICVNCKKKITPLEELALLMGGGNI